MDKRRILEVGPGIRPMHHRSQGEEGLELDDDEEYTGLDQPHAIENMNDHEVWKKAKDRYGERAHIISGNRTNMDSITNASFDELVCLGAHGSATDETIMEFDRVLRPGGILRLGIGSPRLPELMKSWGAQLQQLGYVELASEQLNYGYSANDPKLKSPYTVVSFKKKTNS
jgi:hypothetical protein